MARETEKRRAVVTGASGGIGFALAERLSRDGYDTVLVARHAASLEQRKSQLEGWHGATIHTIAQDLGETAGADALWSALERRGLLPLDVLVNNAGFGTLGAFTEADLDEVEEMIRLNVTALVRLTHHAVRQMRARGSGAVLNVASTAAFQPGPFMAVYYATKAFVLSFSEALHEELRGTGVTVTTLCPGPVATGFQDRARMHDAALLKSPLVQSVDHVADVGMQALRRGRRTAVPGALNRLLALASRGVPKALSLRAVRRMQESRGS